MNKNAHKITFLINFAYVSVIFLVTFFAFKYLLNPLLPFICAFFIVSFSRNIIHKLFDNRLSDKVASIILTLFVSMFLVLVVYVIFYGFFKEINALTKTLTVENINNFTKGLVNNLRVFFLRFGDNSIFARFFDYFAGSFEAIKQYSVRIISQSVPGIISFLMKFLSFFPNAVIFVIITVIAVFYIGADYEKIIKFLCLQFPEKLVDGVEEAKSVFVNTLKELFRAYFILSFITFVQLLAGFAILKIEYSLVLALVICLVDLFPILGTGTVLIPWACVCFVFADYVRGVGILVLYVLITIFRQIAQPKIIGANIGISPLLSLVFMFIGLKIFGFFGIIILPVIATVVISLNSKSIINLYKNVDMPKDDNVKKTRLKFLRFKMQDK